MAVHRRLPAWILELLVFVVLMATFAALVPQRPMGGARGETPRGVFFLFGYVTSTCVFLVLSGRAFQSKAWRTRPAAIAALETLDLSSEESRRAFLAEASPYASAHLDTVGDRVWRLVDALRWSSPGRRDFGTLEVLLGEARLCLSIERGATKALASWLKQVPRWATAGLNGSERWILTGGLLLAPAMLWAIFPTARNPEPFLRAMLLLVAIFAAPVLAARWFTRGTAPLDAELSRVLEEAGLENGPIAVSVARDLVVRGITHPASRERDV